MLSGYVYDSDFDFWRGVDDLGFFHLCEHIALGAKAFSCFAQCHNRASKVALTFHLLLQFQRLAAKGADLLNEAVAQLYRFPFGGSQDDLAEVCLMPAQRIFGNVERPRYSANRVARSEKLVYLWPVATLADAR